MVACAFVDIDLKSKQENIYIYMYSILNNDI